MIPDFASIFWPPTVLAGILILALTLVVARVYPYARKKRKFKDKATIKFNDESFFLRGLATGISLSSLLVQASNVQPFAALSGAGIGQLYIALGLLIACGILASNLKQRLDSYVIPITEAETEKMPEVISIQEQISQLGWMILEAARDSAAKPTDTVTIAKAVGHDLPTVYEEYVILRDTGYFDYVDESGLMAVVKINGSGLQALRAKSDSVSGKSYRKERTYRNLKSILDIIIAKSPISHARFSESDLTGVSGILADNHDVLDRTTIRLWDEKKIFFREGADTIIDIGQFYSDVKMHCERFDKSNSYHELA